MRDIKIKERLIRSEKRLAQKLKSPQIYKWLITSIFLLFGFKKKFFIFGSNKKSKKKAIASVTSDSLLGKKISYIDDFIVDKRFRGKGIGSSLLGKLLNYIGKKEQSEYVVLVTQEDRKASHHLYKKFGFKLISLGIAYLAYKKINKK